VPFSQLLVDEHLAGVHRQRAATGHRIGSVDGEVEQHLLELYRVDHDRRERRRHRRVHLDVVTQ